MQLNMRMLKFCSAPWKTVTVQSSGDVQSCLCGDWNNAGTLGNLLTHTMGEIMQTANVNRLREGVLDQSFSLCKDVCPKVWSPEQVEKFPDYINHAAVMPTEILLAIDRRCNLKCPSCRVTNIFDKAVDPIARDILDTLVRSYREHTTPTVLQMDGDGDVFASEAWRQFLSRSDLPECFGYHIITNGNLVLKNKHILTRLRDRITSVDVSLDAAQEHTYSHIRGGRLETVIEGMKWMRGEGIRTHISFVTQRRNYREMLECWKLAQELGCHSINFQGIKRYPHMSVEYWQHNRLEGNPNVDMDYLHEALNTLSNAPTIVDFTGKSPPPVYMDGNLRKFIDQR